MFSYEKIRQRVALDCRDTEGDYDNEIAAAFEFAAIDLKRESFFVNELRQAKLTFPKGQPIVADPYGFYNIQKIELNYGNLALPIQKMRPGDNDLYVKNDPQGPPMWWDYFDGAFKLYPTPDRDYEALVYAVGASNLNPSDNGGVEAAFDDELFPYLYYLTKYYLATNALNDADMAAVALNGFQKQQYELQRLTELKKRTGRIASNW